MENYYNVQDVQQILGYSKAQSYKVIKRLNNELLSKGFLVRPGRIPKKYFCERFGL